MSKALITEELIGGALHLIVTETYFKEETISFEIQDDFQFLLISIAIDEFAEADQSPTFKRLAHLLNRLMPSRKGDYSWMVNFKEKGKVVDSYFGGDLDNPNSGL